jgi:hypothetical protein
VLGSFVKINRFEPLGPLIRPSHARPRRCAPLRGVVKGGNPLQQKDSQLSENPVRASLFSRAAAELGPAGRQGVRSTRSTRVCSTSGLQRSNCFAAR